MLKNKDKTVLGVAGIIISIIGFATMISFAVRKDPLYLIIISILFIILGTILAAIASD